MSRKNASENKSSLQSEIYFSKEKPLNKSLDEIVEQEISSYHEAGIFDKKEIIFKDGRIEEFANIIFNHNVYYYRKRIIDYINSLQIKLIWRMKIFLE